jgi:hypothetical protein
MRGSTGFHHIGSLAPKAEDLVREYGDSLLDRRVFTQPIGDWPGGAAKVIQIMPDENAPEIVFQVRSEDTGEEIGVFDCEPIMLLTEKQAS